jgi:hypothetical protein
LDATIGVKNCLRAQLLRARTFYTCDYAQRDGFTTVGCLGKGLEDQVLHATRGSVSHFSLEVEATPRALSELHENVPIVTR